jgi:hypothetical protein
MREVKLPPLRPEEFRGLVHLPFRILDVQRLAERFRDGKSPPGRIPISECGDQDRAALGCRGRPATSVRGETESILGFLGGSNWGRLLTILEIGWVVV